MSRDVNFGEWEGFLLTLLLEVRLARGGVKHALDALL
jgi:hypothetical protein